MQRGMIKLKMLANRIDDVLNTLYNYEYVNIDKFYNDSNNKELLDSLDVLLKGELVITKTDEINIIDLYSELDSFIQFETNYNSKIEHF